MGTIRFFDACGMLAAHAHNAHMTRASGFAPTFGLIGWDRDTFARPLKTSALWHGGVARANAL